MVGATRPEIRRAGLASAFDELKANGVVAFTEIHNRASRAVMIRLQMVDTGLTSRSGLVQGREGIEPSTPFALYRHSRDAYACARCEGSANERP